MTLAQKFSSAMNGIDDKFIEEALTYERSKKRKPSCVLRIVLVAALISVLLFTSALAFSPSLRENTLNVLVEIFSDHATFRVEGEEPAGSYIAGKIDYSALEETYRLDPEGCYRVDFASGATFFGNNGEIISITVVAIRDGLPKSIEAKEVSALFCRARHASGTHIVFEWMFRKKRSTGSNKRSGYHPKSVCIG